MINWLHTFHPQPTLLAFGPLHIYWYGFFMVLGILAALGISFKLAKYYKIAPGILFDLSFWLIINGLIGARLYDVFLQFSYYLHNPSAILKIWQGGLAIHGAIIAGLITVFIFTKKRKLSFWKLTALVVPGLALAQAIGRWGNYFNQELFGVPTNRAWGIPIDFINRPWSYLTNDFFQPTFLYESLGCLLIFLLLSGFNLYLIKKDQLNDYYFIWTTALYMLLYSVLRFSLEFIRLDNTPLFLNLRWPQVISLILILASFSFLIYNPHAKTKSN